MKYVEEVHWILDKLGTSGCKSDEVIRENIAFVHSLGRKCDCVGWSSLKREDPQAEEILQRIAAFCKENGWTARGLYTRDYEDLETDWYRIEDICFKDQSFGGCVVVPAREGGTISLCNIKAYRELRPTPKSWGRMLYVPERFYGVCSEKALTGLEFCWAKDTGKYVAQQYFAVFATERIPRVAAAWDLEKLDLRKLGSEDGWLPRLGEVFHEWTQLNLPYCYRKEDLPEGGIAYAYVPHSYSCCGMYEILVHRDVAEQLLQEKAIPAGALKPVPVLEHIPSGYALVDTLDFPKPTSAYMEQSLLDYKALIKKDRPLWQISEKDALKLFRKARTDRKEVFGKKLPKAKAEALVGTEYAHMLPYYLVAEGGYLSEEYRLLPVKESEATTKEFFEMLEKEELLESKPDGIVICTCADGDMVLLLQDSTVIRFSHEAPEVTEHWNSLAQFIVDAINEQ